MIYILDRLGTVLSVLTNDSPHGCPYYADTHTESLDGELSYDFTTPGDRPESAHIAEECQVLFTDYEGHPKLCRVKTVDEQHDRGAHVKIVHAEGTHADLNGYRVRPLTFTGEPVESALAALLAGTPWSVGECAWSGTTDKVFDSYPTVLAAVREIIAEAGLEIEWRVTFDRNRVTSRTCNVIERIGADTGKTITYRKDIKGVRRTSDSSEFYTAMLGVGAALDAGGSTLFTDVVWTIAGGKPADKPVDTDYVTDVAAVERWGLILGVFTDDAETSPTKLLDKTWAALQANKEPRYSYEVDALLLDRLPGRKHERVSLGDTVRVKDPTFDPPLLTEVRVSEIRRSYSDPTGTGFAVKRGVM